MKRLIAVAGTILPVLALAETGSWTIDSNHTDSTFAVKHLVISTVRGHFGKTTGSLKIDEADFTRSSVEAQVDVSTIDTRVPNRDTHLRSPDFFDVAKYPTLTFRSTRVERKGPDHLAVTGDLTMRGTTRPVTFDVTYTPVVKGPAGEERRGFTATARIDRRDFGLRWAKAVDQAPIVGDEVSIEIDAEAVKDRAK